MRRVQAYKRATGNRPTAIKFQKAVVKHLIQINKTKPKAVK